MTCWICRTLPELQPGSALTAAVHSQLCVDCGSTLHTHSDAHPHATALCPGFQDSVWARDRRTPVEETP